MRITVAMAVACLIGGLSVADSAKASIKRYTNIPAQNLGVALQALAEQREVQVIYFSASVDTKSTQGAVGKLSMDETLTRLLNGTGLTYKYLDDKTVTITPATAPATNTRSTNTTATPTTPAPDASAVKGDQKSFWDWFRLAQVDQGQNVNRAATAEQSGSSPLKLEEVIVTAQKRVERAIDVPISIVALTSDEIEKRKVTSIDDLALIAPGVALSSNGSATRQIYIRGVGNAFGTSNLTGIYLDEAAVTSPINPVLQVDVSTYDLERVEVLRGPQGTLYGEGAVGGTIRFITRDPVLSQFSMQADILGRYTEDGSSGGRIQGVMNLPVVKDTVALRIVGTVENQGGWIDQPAANKKDFNDQHLVDVRVKGLWQVNPQFAVNTTVIVNRKDAPPSNNEDADGNYTQFLRQTTTPKGQNDFELYNLTLSYDFDSFRILNTTSYLDQQRELENWGQIASSSYSPGAPRTEILYDQYKDSGHALTEELRATSTGPGPWHWTLGAFYRDSHFRTDLPSYHFAVLGPPGTPLTTPFTFVTVGQSESRAVFGDVSYELTDRFTLGSGMRYFEDEQETASGAGFGAPPVLGQTISAKFHALSPRFYAQYKLTSAANLYASASRGFRSGGINALNRPLYDPESVWTYELGTKTSWSEGRLFADAAIFYTDYSDYIINGTVITATGPLGIFSNAGDARIEGIEATLIWRPTFPWRLSFGGTYLDTKFLKINTLPNPVTGLPTSSYIVGDELPDSPKYQFTLSAQRDFSWNSRSGFARLDYNQQGRMTYRLRNVGLQVFDQSDVINMLNFNLGLQFSEQLSFTLFGQNLLDDRGYTSTRSILGNAGRSRPRTYGVGFQVNFD
jgi:iron complex outermembrane recepter protein